MSGSIPGNGSITVVNALFQPVVMMIAFRHVHPFYCRCQPEVTSLLIPSSASWKPRELVNVDE